MENLGQNQKAWLTEGNEMINCTEYTEKRIVLACCIAAFAAIGPGLMCCGAEADAEKPFGDSRIDREYCESKGAELHPRRLVFEEHVALG